MLYPSSSNSSQAICHAGPSSQPYCHVTSSGKHISAYGIEHVSLELPLIVTEPHNQHNKHLHHLQGVPRPTSSPYFMLQLRNHPLSVFCPAKSAMFSSLESESLAIIPPETNYIIHILLHENTICCAVSIPSILDAITCRPIPRSTFESNVVHSRNDCFTARHAV